MDFLLGKVRKQLSHWANRSLSFVGKTVLLRHVLWAIPIYHFMSMALNTTGYCMLEGVCKDFLWGKNEVGKQKKSLIAWKNIACGRAEGGLGLEPFQEKGRALKMRWFSRLFLEPDIV